MYKIKGLFNNLIDKVLTDKLKTKLMKFLWASVCNVYIIRGLNDFPMIEPKIKCNLVPITLDNCHRVKDFREESRVAQYREKLNNNEIGCFAEHNGKMIGSIWATINKAKIPRVVQTFKRIMYNEASTHDAVVSEAFRGMRIGPYLVSNMRAYLFKEHAVSRIITDVSIRNHASLQMQEKLGSKIDHKMLCISIFDKPVLKLVLKRFK
jgi:GNAT superfamily N-acetyltransferase